MQKLLYSNPLAWLVLVTTLVPGPCGLLGLQHAKYKSTLDYEAVPGSWLTPWMIMRIELFGFYRIQNFLFTSLLFFGSKIVFSLRSLHWLNVGISCQNASRSTRDDGVHPVHTRPMSHSKHTPSRVIWRVPALHLGSEASQFIWEKEQSLSIWFACASVCACVCVCVFV